jgi:hypothetical protein
MRRECIIVLFVQNVPFSFYTPSLRIILALSRGGVKDEEELSHLSISQLTYDQPNVPHLRYQPNLHVGRQVSGSS